MKLIPNWKRAHRMLTVQLATVMTAWGLLPPETQSSMLAALGIPVNRLPAVLGLLLIVGRLIQQPTTKE